MLPREKIEREIAYLAIAIEKTAGPREHEAWSWLMQKRDAFYAGELSAARSATAAAGAQSPALLRASGIDAIRSSKANEGMLDPSRQLADHVAPDSGADDGRVPADETARQDERRRVHDLAHLRFGEKLREPLPGGLVRLGGCRARSCGRAARREAAMVFSRPSAVSIMSAPSGKLPENAMDVRRHRRTIRSSSGVHWPANGTQFRTRHQERSRARPV